MKKAIKKALAVLLAALMLLGVGAVGVFAEEEAEAKKLVAPEKITIKTNKVILYADLFKGTTWDLSDLSIHFSYFDSPPFFRRTSEGFYATHDGRGTITARAPDGESVKIEIKVKFTIWDSFRFFCLFGFLHSELEEDLYWLMFLPFLPLIWLLYSFGFISTLY